MSEWETIAPRAGQKARAGGITVGWRKVSSARFCAVLTLSRDALALLGLREPAKGAPKPRVLVQRNRAANALRLTVSEAPDAWAMHWKQGCGAVAVPLDGVDLNDRRPAEQVAHALDGQSLVVNLPEWARATAPKPEPVPPGPVPPSNNAARKAAHAERTRAGMAAAKAARMAGTFNSPKPSDAAPDCPLAKLPAEDLAEARNMIRSGKVGAKALAEYFGWEHDQAVKIAAALRDEIAAAGRAA